MINIIKLTEEAQREFLQVILENLVKEEPDLLKEDVELLLDSLVDALDTLAEDDGFGTEGWEHRFGIEL
jgi:hypothetical protein